MWTLKKTRDLTFVSENVKGITLPKIQMFFLYFFGAQSVVLLELAKIIVKKRALMIFRRFG